MVGDIKVYPIDNLSYEIDAGVFIEAIKDKINDQTLRKLTSETYQDESSQNLLRSNTIQNTGIEIEFNESNLEILVKIPPKLRRSNTVYVTGRGQTPSVENATTPNDFSAYVNSRANQDINVNQLNATSGRQALRVDVDSATYFKSFVVEGNGTYTERAKNLSSTTIPPLWTRGDVRMVKDFPNQMIRIAAGDLSFPVSNYQSFRPMAGITVASNFSLQPYRDSSLHLGKSIGRKISHSNFNGHSQY